MDLDCFYMYQTLEDHKINLEPVFNLDLDDIKTMGPPLGELKRFVQAISENKVEQTKKIEAASK